VPTPRDWKVTIGGRIDGVTNDSRFPAFFEAALNADPEVHMIQFGEANWPHFVSAVLRISAPDPNVADALGQDILRRNLRVAARAIIGDERYSWEMQVAREPFISSP
jgi:hypothetical protein